MTPHGKAHNHSHFLFYPLYAGASVRRRAPVFQPGECGTKLTSDKQNCDAPGLLRQRVASDLGMDDSKHRRCIAKYGCSCEQLAIIRLIEGNPIRRFTQQRANAMARGIAWELNLWQWWYIWLQSAKWDQRGRGAEGYVMCRYGDTGPYAVGNVYIATGRENVSQARTGDYPSPEGAQ